MRPGPVRGARARTTRPGRGVRRGTRVPRRRGVVVGIPRARLASGKPRSARRAQPEEDEREEEKRARRRAARAPPTAPARRGDRRVRAMHPRNARARGDGVRSNNERGGARPNAPTSVAARLDRIRRRSRGDFASAASSLTKPRPVRRDGTAADMRFCRTRGSRPGGKKSSPPLSFHWRSAFADS